MYFVEHMHVDVSSGASASVTAYPSNKASGDAKMGIFCVVADDNPADANKDMSIFVEGTANEANDAWAELIDENTAVGIDSTPAVAGYHGSNNFYQATGSSKRVYAVTLTLMPIMRVRVVAVASSTNVLNTFLVF